MVPGTFLGEFTGGSLAATCRMIMLFAFSWISPLYSLMRFDGHDGWHMHGRIMAHAYISIFSAAPPCSASKRASSLGPPIYQL